MKSVYRHSMIDNIHQSDRRNSNSWEMGANSMRELLCETREEFSCNLKKFLTDCFAVSGRCISHLLFKLSDKMLRIVIAAEFSYPFNRFIRG